MDEAKRVSTAKSLHSQTGGCVGACEKEIHVLAGDSRHVEWCGRGLCPLKWEVKCRVQEPPPCRWPCSHADGLKSDTRHKTPLVRRGSVAEECLLNIYEVNPSGSITSVASHRLASHSTRKCQFD